MATCAAHKAIQEQEGKSALAQSREPRTAEPVGVEQAKMPLSQNKKGPSEGESLRLNPASLAVHNTNAE